MTDTQTFGRESVEQRLGFETLKDTPPPPPPLDVKEGADEIGSRKPPPDPQDDMKRWYEKRATGEKYDHPIAVTAEKAAHDLTEIHQTEANQKGVFADIELAIAVEDARQRAAGNVPTYQAEGELPQQAGEQPNAPKQEKQEAKQEQPQPGQPGADLPPNVRAALEIPEVRDELQKQFGQAAQARAAYAQAVDDAGRLAEASLVATVPELNGLSADQAAAALNIIAAQNPQRAAQIVNQIQTVQNLAAHSRALQQQSAQQQAQEAEQRFQAWGKEQDDKFVAANREFADPTQAPKLRAQARDYLVSVGIPEAQLPKLMSSDLFRDSIAQNIVYDAMRYRAAKEASKNAVPANVPQVQRPGTGGSRSNDNSERVERLSSRLPELRGNAALEASAKLIGAMRAGKGR